MRPPVVLLVFANDRRGGPGHYMRELVREKREVVEALRSAERAGYCRVIVDSDASLRTLGDALDIEHDTIEVVHYGGHASESGIILEDHAGRPREALAAGLAQRLGTLPRLSLVVLNGCATRGHVEHIHRHARAPIIATDRAVRDDIARDVARRLYHSLAAGRTIREAFMAAEGDALALASGGDAPAWPVGRRMLRPATADPRGSDTPWRLVVHPEAPQAAEWRLVPRPSRADEGKDQGDAPPALADVLAQTHGTPSDARSLLIGAGVPPSRILPMRGAPIAWWRDTLAKVDAGLADRAAIIRRAVSERPDNDQLVRWAARTPVSR